MCTFGTAGIRGDVTGPLRPENVVRISRAVAAEGNQIVLGRDGRTSGDALARAAIAGIQSGGGTVIDCGVVPTPVLAFISRERFGLMITASHNPPWDNGIKVFKDGAEIDRETEQRIEDRIEHENAPVSWDTWGSKQNRVATETYLEWVTQYVETIGEEPAEISVVIDGGNGTGGALTGTLLRRMGANVTELNARVDGHFPARSSKPTPASVRVLRSYVADAGADIGIALDGDADRVVVIDSAGTVVHEDTILAILAREYVNQSTIAEPIVITTPNASSRIDRCVSAAGGRIERVALGRLHEGIVQINQQTVDESSVVFAAEPWKHIHPSLGPWIDGIASAGILTRLVAAFGSLDRLGADVPSTPYAKRGVPCERIEHTQVLTAVETELRERFPDGSADTRYGFRLSLSDDHWILLRASGTEPKLRIYVEHPEAEMLVREIESLIKKYRGDNSPPER